MPIKLLLDPWKSFFSEIDPALEEEVPLYCLDLTILQQRYEKELRPDLGNPEREDLTLELWIEAIREERQGRKI